MVRLASAGRPDVDHHAGHLAVDHLAVDAGQRLRVPVPDVGHLAVDVRLASV